MSGGSGTEAAPASGAPAGSPVAVWLTGRRAVLVVLGIFLSLVMGALDNFVVLTALPNIVTDLHQPNGVTFVVSSYLIAGTIAIPIFGKLSDILSRRNVFLIALAIFIAGSVLAGLSQNLNQLIAFRGVQGFGQGGFFPVGLSIIATVFPPEARARVTGILSGVFAIGTIAGPLLGSFIVDHASWRWVFYINIPVGVLGMAVIASSLGALRPQRRSTYDVAGAALLSLWVGALVLALFQVSDRQWTWADARTIGLLLGAVATLVVFVIWELRTTTPLVPLGLFRRRVVSSSGSIAFLRGFAFFSLVTFISIYVGLVLLHGGPGSADTVRNVLYGLVIPMVIAAALAGQLLTRIPYRPVVAAGLAIASFGGLLLTTVTTSTPTWQFSYGFLPTGGILVDLIPVGFGVGLTFAPTVLAVQYQVAPQDVGAATSLVTFLQSLGAAVGISVLGTVQQSFFDQLKPSPPLPSCAPPCFPYLQALQAAIATSYVDLFRLLFGLFVVTFLLSLFLSGRLPKRPTGPAPPSGE